MMHLTRVSLALLGALIYFISMRYLDAYEVQPIFVGFSYLLIGASLLVAAIHYMGAKKKAYFGEAKAVLISSIWQFMLLVSILLFQLDHELKLENLSAKIVLVLWLSLAIVSFFYAMGSELEFRKSSQAQYAEPKRVKLSALRWSGIGLFLCFLMSVNYGVSKKDAVFDWSYFKTTQAGESTKAVVANLDKPVEVAIFLTRGSEVSSHIDSYFNDLEALNTNLQVSTFDKDVSPLESERFRASRNGQIVLMQDSKRQRIEIGDSLESARKNLISLDSKFQQSLLALVERKKVVYILQGYNEMQWREKSDSPWRSVRDLDRLLRLQNYTVRELNLASVDTTKIPEDAAAVFILAPALSYTQSVMGMLETYVASGGKLAIWLDVLFEDQENDILEQDQRALDTWLEGLGISYKRSLLANDKTFMRFKNQISDHAFIATNSFSSHPSVTNLAKNENRLGVVSYQSGYFEILSENKLWNATPIIRSLNSTFNDENRNFRFDEGEQRDSYIVAMALENKDARILLYADASMVSDPLLRNPGNQLAVADTLKWLVGAMEYAGVTESEEDVRIQHSKARDLFIFHGSIYAIPLLVLFAGWMVTRRSKEA